jgi:hypothetical protein
MHNLHKVVESKPEGHRTRGASRPAGRGRTNFLALVFAAVPLTTGACGDFPSTCEIGACGCSPENSHEVRTCECPAGHCYDPAFGCIIGL